MKLFRFSRILTATLCITLTAFGTMGVTRASEPEKPMALRAVMQQLERDMRSVTGAISREEWSQVVELAPGIGSHPQPPLREKMRILAWLGTAAGTFRGFDTQTREAAEAMGEAAARSDGQAVIAAFARLQQSCLGCHQNYRKSFREHFYEHEAVAAADESLSQVR